MRHTSMYIYIRELVQVRIQESEAYMEALTLSLSCYSTSGPAIHLKLHVRPERYMIQQYVLEGPPGLEICVETPTTVLWYNSGITPVRVVHEICRNLFGFWFSL